MSSLQLDIGVPNGIEQVIHTVQLGMQLNSNLNFLKTDLSNAFNALDREKLPTSCREFAPQIYPMVHALYGPVGQLSVVGESCVQTIESAMGAQQGDIKGPFLFVNAIHQQFVEGLANILRPYEGYFVQFIIDDGNFLLSDEAVLEVLLFTMEHGPPLGIYPMVHALYGPVGQLSVVGESCVHTIESAMGAQQGDVKGPFFS